jgi:glutaredoxin|tara:strand:- start:162 stop:527 length:366 start_codon:yes stop_codon:yes gene_type:complete
MIKYIIYTQKNCIYCAEAKSIFDEAGEVYEERKLDTAEKVRRFKNAGHTTVPQIFLHIGGFHELEEFFFGDEVSFKPDLKLVEDTKRPQIGALSGEKKVISFAEKRALVKGRKLLEDKEDK